MCRLTGREHERTAAQLLGTWELLQGSQSRRDMETSLEGTGGRKPGWELSRQPRLGVRY